MVSEVLEECKYILFPKNNIVKSTWLSDRIKLGKLELSSIKKFQSKGKTNFY